MKRRVRTTAVRLGLAAAVLAGSAGCQLDTDQQDDAASSSVATSGSALDLLATLPVKGRAPKTGYERDAFGVAWSDVDHNGCDTRNDVLNRDLTLTTYKVGTHNCVVASGTLADPYTGTSIPFVRGDGTSVDIDHVVALSDAWQTGAYSWTEARRTALANDPANLLAVDYSANRQKGDADAASWLPKSKTYRCDYVARQVAVKAAYGLWVTSAEHDAIAGVLAGCPGQEAPADPAAPTASTSRTAASGTSPAPSSSPASSSSAAATSSASATSYANCAAVREAGAAPLHRGDPGYSTTLDGDGDGTACE